MEEEQQAYYQDRGMMKWQGLILSEHNEMLKSLRANSNYHYEAPEEMSPSQIQEELLTAYHSQEQVRVTLNLLENDRYFYCLGQVAGYEEGDIYIGRQRVALDSIRHVERQAKLKFWQ